MATHESAVKKQRQDERRRLRNRMHVSRMRTAVKKLRKAIAAGSAKAAADLLPETLAILDRSVERGVLHRNSAARTKSRLAKAVARARGAA
jgi:small subunit ribosomal protein S20